MKNEETYTMSQVRKLLGAPALRIRRLCNLGLVPGLRYSFGQRRIFTARQVNWLKTLYYLGRLGFTNKDLRRYVQLERNGGRAAREEQKAMIATHKQHLWQKIAEIQDTLNFFEAYEKLL